MWFVIIGGSMINFHRQSRVVALRAEMHGYALRAQKSVGGRTFANTNFENDTCAERY